MIIYKVTSKTSNKSYIGQSTKRLNDRKHSHIKNVKAGVKTKFYNAIRKYGESDFVWEIIDNAENKELLNELEIKYISKYDTYKTGYNMTLGGDGGDTISMKSNVEKQNQGAKLGNIPWNKGKSMLELGYNFYDTRKPRQFTDKQKEEHSELIKNSKKFKEGIQSRTPAKQVIIEDDLGNRWNTQKDFIQHIGISHHIVRAGLKNGSWEHCGRVYRVIKRK
jgi:group I intron endonuclease